MNNLEKNSAVEAAVNTINITYKRVLIMDRYEGYELQKMISALQLLLQEAEKK